MSRLAQDMKKLAHRTGGSHKTVHDREKMAQRFTCHLLTQYIQVTSTTQLKARHIAGYIHERLTQGISLRTLQNEMAMVRSILAEAGRTQLSQSELISNQSLGISGASRDGRIGPFRMRFTSRCWSGYSRPTLVSRPVCNWLE